MLSSTSSPSAKIWVGLLTILLLLSLNTAVSLLGSYRLTQLRERVEHIHTELLGIERIYSTAVDAETGQRGYLLTGEERYLEPYRQALSRVDQEREQLQSLLADDPAQQPRFQHMNQDIVGILDELRDTIELRKTKGFEAAIAVITADRGKRLMDQMRVLLTEMEQEEQDLLVEGAGQSGDAQSHHDQHLRPRIVLGRSRAHRRAVPTASGRCGSNSLPKHGSVP